MSGSSQLCARPRLYPIVLSVFGVYSKSRDNSGLRKKTSLRTLMMREVSLNCDYQASIAPYFVVLRPYLFPALLLSLGQAAKTEVVGPN